MLLALNPFGDIVGITAFAGSLYAACFLPTLVVGLYWKGGTAVGSLSCVLLGSTTVIAWHFARRAGWTSWHEVYAGFGVAILAYVVISLMTSKPKQLASNKSLELDIQRPITNLKRGHV